MDDDEEQPVCPDLSRFDVQEDLTPYSEFQMRPLMDQRFKSTSVKEVIHTVLNDQLGGKIYGEENVESLVKDIANSIRQKLKGTLYNRYKLVVHVELGEQRGAGIKSSARCLWDPECDSYASDTFTNDTMFCVATVFGIYFY